MNIPVDFEWDAAKADINLRKHRVPFDAVLAIFLDPDHVVLDTLRAEDGEHRYKVIGTIDGRVLAVVFVMRGSTCRFISARRANAKEERIYGTR